MDGVNKIQLRAENRLMAFVLGSVTVLCLARVIFCWIAPEVLSGWTGLKSDLTFIAFSLCLAAGGFYYLQVRNEPYLALSVFFSAFFFLGGVGNYRTQYILFHVGRDFSFVDDTLAAIDRALGFDWTLYFHLVVGDAWVHALLRAAYESIWFQPLVITVLHIARKDFWSFGNLQVALPLSFAFVCLVATFLPAIGAYDFHDMDPQRHAGISVAFTDGATAPVRWLRQAVLPANLPDFPDLRVVTFPSWHAAAALVFMMSAWSIPVVRWFAVALNLAMLAATPVHGSHYLADTIVGALLGATAFLVAGCLLAPRAVPRQRVPALFPSVRLRLRSGSGRMVARRTASTP
ncbi:phosphatase PAP2 family protein [Methylobacterium sp. M6A4_1b]